MKNVTLSAEGPLIEAARERARLENTTLNEQFRRWLAAYAQPDARLAQHDALMARLRGQFRLGRKLDRDAMNER